MKQLPRPPRLGLLVLSLALPKRDSNDIVGDLTEIFSDRMADGRRGTRFWFWSQVLIFGLSFRFLSRQGKTRSPFGGTSKRRPTPPGYPQPERWRLDMGGVWTRIRQTTRRLSREWRYSLGVILILGIGIGPAAAMLSVVQKVLLQPLAYEDPDQLGLVRIDLGELHAHPGLTHPEITDLRAVDGLFADVEATSRQFEISLGEDGDLKPVSALRVTPGMFDMLGAVPQLGRYFTDDDAEEFVAMISHELWTTHFGGDTDVIGQTMTLNGRPAPIVGVLPPGFAMYLGRGSQLSTHIDVWMPLDLLPRRTMWAFPTIVRLAEGVTFDQVNARLEAFTESLVERVPEVYANTSARFAVHPLLPDLVRQAKPAIHAALAGVLLLLLIAIANGTALVMARMTAREVDFAVRAAMGAGRRALLYEVLIESLILMSVGVLLGGAIAAWGIVGLQALIPDTVPRAGNIVFGWDLLGYSAMLGFAGLALAGLIPAWKASRGAPLDLLRGSSGQRGATRATGRLALVGSQIAMTVVLSFGAVQLARSAFALAATDIKFDPENVLAFAMPVDASQFHSFEESLVFHHELRDRLGDLPGVLAVGAVSHLPLSGTGPMDAFGPGAVGDTVGWSDPLANYFAVVPGYFESIGARLRQGRFFTDEEDLERRAVVVIDESLAEMTWPGEDPIGKTMRMGWQLPPTTVVGVIAHPRVIDVSRDVRPQIYVPYGLFPWGPLRYTVKAENDPNLMIAAVRDVLDQMRPGRAAFGFQDLSENVAAAMSTLRFVTLLVALLAFSATFLSALGLFAVVSYVVHQRRRATAIRGAMGASPAQLIHYHLKSGILILGVAVPIGSLLSLVSARFVEALLYGVRVHDVLSLGAAILLAAVTGLAGTFIPALIGARQDPVIALRAE